MNKTATIQINHTPLSLADIRKTYQGPIELNLNPQIFENIDRSQQTITNLLNSERPIYGVNTGFGKLAKQRIAMDDLASLQRNIVRSHAAGVGEPLAAPIVRLILLLKLKSLTAGFSGVRRETIELMANMLKHDILPLIPTQGSVGASGDLAPLAHMALVMIGEGQAFIQGEKLRATEALSRFGLSPISLKAKEGLGLLNGTQVSTALALSALIDSEQILHASIISGALSVEAIKGSHAPFDARIHELRPHRGQCLTAAQYRRLLNGSEIEASHHECDRVQDPYSFRCQPQVIGACVDLAQRVADTLMIEANSVTDNPLVFSEDEAIISGGNFHAEPVAFAADTLALAITEIGSLSERRIAAMIDTSISLLPPFLTQDPGLNSGYMLAQVTAAALASENKQQAYPSSVDSIPTSANQEDHVSMATHGAYRLHRMNANTRRIIAIELMAAAEGIEFHRPLSTSSALEKAHKNIRSQVAKRDQDRVFSEDIESVNHMILNDAFSGFLDDLIEG